MERPKPEVSLMPSTVILKKDWASHRGKLFHSGTIFEKVPHNEFPTDPANPGSWYNFKTPKDLPLPYVSNSFGCIFIPKF